jgi:hypothetical protein|tara:strand:- start:363 stop:578 length:216 start_codon:yes stop_codon:yes gene_type:complete
LKSRAKNFILEQKYISFHHPTSAERAIGTQNINKCCFSIAYAGRSRGRSAFFHKVHINAPFFSDFVHVANI